MGAQIMRNDTPLLNQTLAKSLHQVETGEKWRGRKKAREPAPRPDPPPMGEGALMEGPGPHT